MRRLFFFGALTRALIHAKRENRRLIMDKQELLTKIEGVRQEAAALRTERDSLAAENAALKVGQDLADVGAAVDGIHQALQPVPEAS
jgi:cell division protein FtsB